MTGNFQKNLEVIWDGTGVVARGPLEWDEEDKSVSLHVAILQNGVAAVGWTGNDIPRGADEFVVAAAAEGDGKLKDGPATATGWAFVHGNGIEMYEWTVPVNLSEHGLVGALSPGRGGQASPE